MAKALRVSIGELFGVESGKKLSLEDYFKRIRRDIEFIQSKTRTSLG